MKNKKEAKFKPKTKLKSTFKSVIKEPFHRSNISTLKKFKVV